MPMGRKFKAIVAALSLAGAVVGTGAPAWAGFAAERPIYASGHTQSVPGYVLYSDQIVAGTPVQLGPENVSFWSTPDGSRVTITSASGSTPAFANPLDSAASGTTNCLPSGVFQVTCTAAAPVPSPFALTGLYQAIVGAIQSVDVSLAGSGNVIDGRGVSIPFFVDLTRATGGDVVYAASGLSSINVANGNPDTVYCYGVPNSYTTVDAVDVLVGDCGHVTVS
jgi:hypothetical protein